MAALTDVRRIARTGQLSINLDNAQNHSMSEMAWFRHLGTHALIFDSRRRIGPNLSLAPGTPITQQDSIPTLLSPAAEFMNARAPEVTSN